MTAARIIERLGLSRHPEGGWYRETVRRGSVDGGRDAITAIYFLLEGGVRSAWHRVDADELWLWHAGCRLRLCVAEGIGRSVHVLGNDVLSGQVSQLLIPAGAWQSAEALDGWTAGRWSVAWSCRASTSAASNWHPATDCRATREARQHEATGPTRQCQKISSRTMIGSGMPISHINMPLPIVPSSRWLSLRND